MGDPEEAGIQDHSKRTAGGRTAAPRRVARPSRKQDKRGRMNQPTTGTAEGGRTTEPRLAIDAAALERYLAERLPSYRGPLSIRQFAGGQSNPTYLLETPGARYVLRKKPPGELLPSAHAVDREF